MAFFDDARTAWINNGGPPAIADTMAAIASAESASGTMLLNPSDSNGYPSYGAWQINAPNLGQYGIPNMPAILTRDLNANARAAIAVWKAQGLNAWGTYNPRDGSVPKYLAFLPGSGGVARRATPSAGTPAAASDSSSPVTIKDALGQVKLGYSPGIPAQYLYVVVVTIGLLLLFIALSGKGVSSVH